jgi:hypothetical protein
MTTTLALWNSAPLCTVKGTRGSTVREYMPKGVHEELTSDASSPASQPPQRQPQELEDRSRLKHTAGWTRSGTIERCLACEAQSSAHRHQRGGGGFACGPRSLGVVLADGIFEIGVWWRCGCAAALTITITMRNCVAQKGLPYEGCMKGMKSNTNARLWVSRSIHARFRSKMRSSKCLLGEFVNLDLGPIRSLFSACPNRQHIIIGGALGRRIRVQVEQG